VIDKYGTGQDVYCYPGTDVLKNRLNIRDSDLLASAERDITNISANLIEFSPPPYDLNYLCSIHRHLFADIYDWAGQLRSIDISKMRTRFCTASRIIPESAKNFSILAKYNYFEGLNKSDLVKLAAESYGEINMLHPFREGNGRAQRILYEHMIVNAGFEIDWTDIQADEWLAANIDSALSCDYQRLEIIFDRCIHETTD
jgi:cell filamentation protein